MKPLVLLFNKGSGYLPCVHLVTLPQVSNEHVLELTAFELYRAIKNPVS